MVADAAVGPGVRDQQPAHPQRRAARLPRPGLRPRSRGARPDRFEPRRGGGVDAGAGRQDPGRPDRRRGGRGVGRADDAGARTSGTFDVLVVGARPGRAGAAVYASSEGLQHAGRGAGVDRRAGRVELADPQLPRVLPRDQRRRARAARLPAGVGVRRALRADARGRQARPATGRLFVAHVARRRHGARPGRRRARPGCPTGGSACRSLEALSGKGVYYGANVTAAHALTGLRRGRRRRRQLRRAGGAAPGPLLRARHPRDPRRGAGREPCRRTSSAPSTRTRGSTCAPPPRWSRRGRRPARAGGAARQVAAAPRSTLPRGRAVRDDRRGAAHRLAAGGGRARQARVRADRCATPPGTAG